jgi:tetratricopeptide (TPR) repeat protein
LLALVWVVLGNGSVAQAQGTVAPGVSGKALAAPVNKDCPVNSSAPNAAETELNQRHFGQAESLFRELLKKSPDSDAAHEAVVRALIEQDKVTDAAKEAESWAAAAPSSSMAMVAVGEARLRQGDPRSALAQYQKAMHADPCNARAYFEFAELGGLEGFHATAKRLIEKAYTVHPTDNDIQVAWIATRPRKERLAQWADYAEHSAQISDEDRANLKRFLQKQSLDHASDCRAAANSPLVAAVPIVPVMDGPTRFVAWGLDVQFNGQRRRLQIDTGASGITISRVAADGMGIQGQNASSMGGHWR